MFVTLYFVTTVGLVQLDVIKRYIETQKERGK